MTLQSTSDYFRNSLLMFEHAPPATEFECGFMSALIVAGKALGVILPWAQFERVLITARQGLEEIDQ